MELLKRNLNINILNELYDYINPPAYRVIPEIPYNPKKLISQNIHPGVIDVLAKYKFSKGELDTSILVELIQTEDVDLDNLYSFICENIDVINFDKLVVIKNSRYTGLFSKLIEENIERVSDWSLSLSCHLDIILKNQHKISFDYLLKNCNQQVQDYLLDFLIVPPGYEKTLCLYGNPKLIQKWISKEDQLKHLKELTQNPNQGIQDIIKLHINAIDKELLSTIASNWGITSVNIFLQKKDLVDEEILEKLSKKRSIYILEMLEKEFLDLFNGRCWVNLCSNITQYLANMLERNIDRMSDIDICLYKILENDVSVIKSLVKKIISRRPESVDCCNISQMCKLCYDRDMVEIIKFYRSKITMKSWENICRSCTDDNSDLIDVTRLDPYCWKLICKNKNMIEFIYKNLDKITFETLESLCKNKNPEVIHIIKKFSNYLTDRCWNYLCKNPTDEVVEFVKNKLDILKCKLCWFNCLKGLASNPSKKVVDIVHILVSEANPVIIDLLSSNPNIFIVDGEVLKMRKNIWIKN